MPAAAVAVCVAVAGCGSAMRQSDNGPAPSATTNPAATNTSASVFARDVPQAIADGTSFLLAHQNLNGSWGTGTVSNGNEVYVSVPGSHDSFRVATTALCVMALHAVATAQTAAAHSRGVEYLINHSQVRRDTSDLLLDFWAHIYVIQALCDDAQTRTHPRCAAVINWHIDRLIRSEDVTGGWNYYDFIAGTQRPAAGSTSFTNGAALVALWSARRSGYVIPQPLIDRALRRLRDMRLPNGGFIYDMDLKYHPIMPANTLKGSVGREQVCNLALHTWWPQVISVADCKHGVEDFFINHAPLEMGRKTPVPHSSWYQVSGYYFYFDHYYAAELLKYLDPATAGKFSRQLTDIILPLQEPDGSWWDFALWDYHKPYGTALALMTLAECRMHGMKQ